MKTAAWITLFYGLMILVGGVIGHMKAASTPSLITGTIFGILLLMSAVGMFKDKLFSAYLAVILTLILDAFFTYRWLLTFKFMPSGLMTLISIGVLIAIAILIRNHLKTQRNHRR